MHVISGSALLILFLIVTLPGTAMAESPPSYSGTYELDEEASDDLMEAFEPAVKEMSRFKRPFARRTIRRESGPEAKLRIQKNDEMLIIEAHEDFRVPLNGEPVDHEDNDGDIVQMSAWIDDGVLMVRTEMDDGEYTTEYRLSPDGKQLSALTRIDVEQLPKRVDYLIVYIRQ